MRYTVLLWGMFLLSSQNQTTSFAFASIPLTTEDGEPNEITVKLPWLRRRIEEGLKLFGMTLDHMQFITGFQPLARRVWGQLCSYSRELFQQKGTWCVWHVPPIICHHLPSFHWLPSFAVNIVALVIGDFSRFFSMLWFRIDFLSVSPQVETSLRGELLPLPAQFENGQCPEGFAAGWRCSNFASFLAGTWTQHWPEECSCYCEDVPNERTFFFGCRLVGMFLVLSSFVSRLLDILLVEHFVCYVAGSDRPQIWRKTRRFLFLPSYPHARKLWAKECENTMPSWSLLGSKNLIFSLTAPPKKNWILKDLFFLGWIQQDLLGCWSAIPGSVASARDARPFGFNDAKGDAFALGWHLVVAGVIGRATVQEMGGGAGPGASRLVKRESAVGRWNLDYWLSSIQRRVSRMFLVLHCWHEVLFWCCFCSRRRYGPVEYACFCLPVVFRTCSCVDFSQSPVLPCLRSMLDATQLMGWGGMLTFLALPHMLDATQYVNVPCTCTHVGCYALDGVGWGGVGCQRSLLLHTCWMLRNMLTFLALAHMLDATQLMGWGGVGWGGMLMFLALAHMLDATQYVNVPCTCTHVGCYAIDGAGWGGMSTFLALAHMLDATQYVNVLCTCTHVGCYAIDGAGWGGMLTFLALAHMLDATQESCGNAMYR